MFESRCGICCSQCEGREDSNCTGCTTMSLPFWGSPCGVKSCCDEKGLDHCGLCTEFPCQMLSGMGKEMGYDPAPRLAQLEQWAKEASLEKAAT